METSSPSTLGTEAPDQTLAKITVLVLSDTHYRDDRNVEDDPNVERRESRGYPSADVVIHCGDITDGGELEGYAKAIRVLDSIDAEIKLAIAGNHDSTLDEKFYSSQGGKTEECEQARKIWEDAPSNVHLLKEGVHTFTLATGLCLKIYASPYTPEFGITALQYPTGHDRFNPIEATLPWAKNISTDDSRIPEDVDIVMTHGPPKYILDNCDNNTSGGCEHLRRAVFRVKPRLHCFGHIHRGWGAQRAIWKSQSGINETKTLEGGNKRKRETDSKADLEDSLVSEFVGRGGCKRKGYACLSPGSAAGLLTGKQTLFVNAAIMDGENEPSNFPWLIELPIKKKGAKITGL